MANTINYAERYTDLLDKKYKMEAKTSVLDISDELVRESEMANTVYIPEMTLSGLGDYDRANGFPTGDVTLNWEAKTLSLDRGTEFTIDRVDNMDTMDAAAGNLMGEFVRLHVAPEIDAYRFATMAEKANNVVNADLTNTDTVEAIDTAAVTMDNSQVPEDARILFATPVIIKNIKQSDQFQRDFINIGDMSFDAYDNMPIVKVPQGRFYTGITLNDGSTSFGYTKTTGGTDYEINFMIAHQNAVLPVPKLRISKYFSPDTNQKTDGHLFQFRLHHDLFVPDNKIDGIYVHTKGTAIA